MTRRLTWTLWASAAFLSAGIALISYRYLLGVGPLSPAILANLYTRPWLAVHVAGAATALLTVSLQLVPQIRRGWPRVHRWVGRIYVMGCLIAAAGGFVMAFGSTAGPIATAGFSSLAVIWAITNVQGWRAALDRRFDVHRAWMIRAFALTFAAVTLRLYLPVGPLLGLDFLDTYRAAAFVSWIPNLILAELYLRGAFRSDLFSARPAGPAPAHPAP